MIRSRKIQYNVNPKNWFLQSKEPPLRLSPLNLYTAHERMIQSKNRLKQITRITNKVITGQRQWLYMVLMMLYPRFPLVQIVWFPKMIQRTGLILIKPNPRFALPAPVQQAHWAGVQRPTGSCHVVPTQPMLVPSVVNWLNISTEDEQKWRQ